jgi:hypothetical protein
MRQIAIICVFLIVILLALVGCLVIFEVMDFDKGLDTMLKFGGAIVLLGVCSAAISALMGAKKGD